MDERERKGARGKRSKTAGPQKQRPDRYAHGPSDGQSDRDRGREAAEPEEDGVMQ